MKSTPFVAKEEDNAGLLSEPVAGYIRNLAVPGIGTRALTLLFLKVWGKKVHLQFEEVELGAIVGPTTVWSEEFDGKLNSVDDFETLQALWGME